MPDRSPTVIDVTVSGGSGAVVVSLAGGCIAVGAKKISGTPTYDIELMDQDGFGLFGKEGLSGVSTVPCKIQFWGNTTVLISNASLDGAYQVKLWYDR